jgi:hypothetical protein
VYSPANCFKWATTQREKCMLNGNAPTLGMLSEVYGLTAAAEWLTFHLACINNFFSIPADRQMSGEQLTAVSTTWINAHPRLKSSELWVFLSDWIGGAYGKKVFGAIDPTEMGADVEKYLEQRDLLVAKRLKERERQRTAHQFDAFNAELKRLRDLRNSPDWAALTDEERERIGGFLSLYCTE